MQKSLLIARQLTKSYNTQSKFLNIIKAKNILNHQQIINNYLLFNNNYRLFSLNNKNDNEKDSQEDQQKNVFSSPTYDGSQQPSNEADNSGTDSASQNYTYEFDELKDPEINGKDSAAKNLSLALMRTESSEQCLMLFEQEYLRNQLDRIDRPVIYGEELCLIFYFMIKHISKLALEDGYRLLNEDLRFQTLMQMLFARVQEMDFEYLVTIVWALGIGVSGYDMKIEPEYKLRLLSLFNQREFTDTQIPQIPTFVFSLSCFFNEDMNQLVTEVIEKVSQQYLDNMLDRMDILNASVLLMAWGRSFMNNQEMIDRVAQDIINKHKQKLFYEDEATSEIVNIIVGLSDLRYRNDELMNVIHSYAKKQLDRMSLVQLCTVTSSMASLYPDKLHYFNDYAEELHSRLQDAVKQDAQRSQDLAKNPEIIYELIPDLTTYNNLWLAITCFGVKSNVNLKDESGQEEEQLKQQHAGGMIKLIAKDLIKIFNSNKRWRNTDVNIHEAANVSIAIASLKLQNDNFIADVGDIIRHNIKEASAIDLINLAKSSYYMREFKHTKDIYSTVHAESVSRYNMKKLNEEEVHALSTVFSSHGIMNDSPFAQVRVSRK
eukprot:403331476